MKKLFLFLTLLFVGIGANAQYTPSNNLNYVKLLKVPPVGSVEDSVMVFDGSDSFLKMRPASSMPISTDTRTALDLKLSKITTPDKIYGTDGLGNQLNYTSEILENKQALRDFYNNLYSYSLNPTSSFIGISCWGDSVSPETWGPFVLSLKARYQIGCILQPTGGTGMDFAPEISSTGTIFDSAIASVNQSVYNGTGGFADFTYLPSGKHKEMSNGSVYVFSTGQNTGNDTARVYFATGAGMGSAFVELLNEAGTVVVNSTTVNLSAGSLGATKAQFSIASNMKYRVRVTATGKVIFLVGGFFRTNGIIPFSFGRGGSTLAQNNYSNKTILSYLMSEFNTSLMFLQAKEEDITVSLPATMTTFNTFTTCSKIVVGSAPDSSPASPQIANNLLFRSNALANDFCYFDAYRTMKDWTETVRLGWNSDGTHIGLRGTYYMGMVLQSYMGFFNQIGAIEKKPIDNISNGGTVSTNTVKLAKGDGSQESVDVLTGLGGGIPAEMALKNIRYAAFGVFQNEAPIISAYSTTTIGIFNRAANSLRGLRMGTLTAESINILNVPTTAPSDYDVLVRATSNGAVWKVPSTTFAPTASPELTGTPTAPIPTTPNGIANKGYVDGVARPYKVYTALLTQTGTDAPVATILENTLGGTLVWAYDSIGNYTATLAGVFTSNKSVGFVANGVQSSTTALYYLVERNDIDTMILKTFNQITTSDNLLVNSLIEIRVYN